MGQFVVGKCYDAGWGVVRDYAAAVRLYRIAAAQGYANAKCSLGHKVRLGLGLAHDRAENVRLYRLAAAQGYDNATAALKRSGL